MSMPGLIFPLFLVHWLKSNQTKIWYTEALNTTHENKEIMSRVYSRII